MVRRDSSKKTGAASQGPNCCTDATPVAPAPHLGPPAGRRVDRHETAPRHTGATAARTGRERSARTRNLCTGLDIQRKALRRLRFSNVRDAGACQWAPVGRPRWYIGPSCGWPAGRFRVGLMGACGSLPGRAFARGEGVAPRRVERSWGLPIGGKRERCATVHRSQNFTEHLGHPWVTLGSPLGHPLSRPVGCARGPPLPPDRWRSP